jgi:hypothetical protein
VSAELIPETLYLHIGQMIPNDENTNLHGMMRNNTRMGQEVTDWKKSRPNKPNKQADPTS